MTITSPPEVVLVTAAANDRQGAETEQALVSIPVDATKVRCDSANTSPVSKPPATATNRLSTCLISWRMMRLLPGYPLV